MTTNASGKLVPQKVGLKEVTREGFEYELTLNLEIDTKHNAMVSKDRTGLFAGKPDFIPSEETGKLIREWCETGEDPNEELNNAIKMLSKCNTVEDLKMLKDGLDISIRKNKAFEEAAIKMFNEINKPNNETTNLN